jgi:catechol 2,3-dioxygenase-like lactoylglutathione lyase family enzyme
MVTFDHASLAVTNIDDGIRFFASLFGAKVQFVERGMSDQIASMLGNVVAHCDLVQMSLPGTDVRLELIAFDISSINTASRELPVACGMGHVAIRCDDFDASVARAKEMGAELVGSITQFEKGRSVYLRTPFGAFIEIEETTARPIAVVQDQASTP